MHKVYPNLRNLALYFLNSFTPFFRFFVSNDSRVIMDESM